MGIVKAATVFAGFFSLLALGFSVTWPAQRYEGSTDNSVLEIPNFQERQISRDAVNVDFSSPDSLRDREALALLLAEYSRRTFEWAPSTDSLWGVLSSNVVYGYPTGKRIWVAPEVDAFYWRQLLLSQGGLEPLLIRSHPKILIMFSEEDCFLVFPARVVGSNDAKAIVLFGRQFYRSRHVEGVLQGQIGRDFLAALQAAEEIKNPRAEAELVQRLIYMAGQLSYLNFLVSNDNLERFQACIDHPEINTSECADMIWDYELAAANSMLSASQKLAFCPRTDSCERESDLNRISPPLTMFQFFRRGVELESILSYYLNFILPNYYKEQAAFFKEYWAKHD